jgi:hypothetical protein
MRTHCHTRVQPSLAKVLSNIRQQAAAAAAANRKPRPLVLLQCCAHCSFLVRLAAAVFCAATKDHSHRAWLGPRHSAGGLAPATSAPGLGSPRPHLHGDSTSSLHQHWAHPCHICTGTGHTPALAATGTGLTPATSAPLGLGSPAYACTGLAATSRDIVGCFCSHLHSVRREASVLRWHLPPSESRCASASASACACLCACVRVLVRV